MFGILVEFRLIELFFLYLVLVLVHLRDHCLVFGHYFDGRGQLPQFKYERRVLLTSI